MRSPTVKALAGESGHENPVVRRTKTATTRHFLDITPIQKVTHYLVDICFQPAGGKRELLQIQTLFRF